FPYCPDGCHGSFLAIGQTAAAGGRRQECRGQCGLLLVATIATATFRRSEILFEDIDPGQINGLHHELLVLIVVHLFSPPFLVGCASTASTGREAKNVSTRLS